MLCRRWIEANQRKWDFAGYEDNRFPCGGTGFAKLNNEDQQPGSSVDEGVMRNLDRRVLRDFRIDAAEWAVLFAASYYEPIPGRRFIELATWEADGEVSENDVSEALSRCISKNWVALSHDEPALFVSEEPEETVVLTELGYQLKNTIVVAMMETVPLVVG